MPQYPHPHSQPQPGAVGPQQMPNGAMMRQGQMGAGPMNSFPHGPAGMGNPSMTLPLGGPPMGGAMSMGPQPGNMMMNVSEVFLNPPFSLFRPCK